MKRMIITCGALAASVLLFTGCVYHSCGGPGRGYSKKNCAPQANDCEEVETMTIEAVAVPANAPQAPQASSPAPAKKHTPANN